MDGSNFDRIIGVVGLIVGIAGIAFAYLSITSERFSAWLVSRGIKKLPKDFLDLALAYKAADSIPDEPAGPVERNPWERRVAKKDILAEGLGRYAQAARLDRKHLAAAEDDGYVAALMKLITFGPQEDDIKLIAQAAKCKVPAHTDYQTLEAIDAVIAGRLIFLQQQNITNGAIDLIDGRLGAGGKSRVGETRQRLRNLGPVR